MKTAISIPDPIFNQAEKLAHKQGISRSELYTKAIAEYIKEKKEKNVTEVLDSIYNDNSNTVDKEIYSIQYSSLKVNEDKW